MEIENMYGWLRINSSFVIVRKKILKFLTLLVFCLPGCSNSLEENRPNKSAVLRVKNEKIVERIDTINGRPIHKGRDVVNTLMLNSSAFVSGRNSIGGLRWDFDSVEIGNSIVVKLLSSEYIIEASGGGAYESIIFSLPSKIQLGDTYELKGIPRRRGNLSDQDSRFKMLDGEIVASKFAEPSLAIVKKFKRAEVKVLSLSREKREAVIRLNLEANLEKPLEGFEINHEYLLDVM